MYTALMMRLTDLRESVGNRVLSETWRTVTMGAIMGVKDFNERNGRYASILASDEIRDDCDVEIVPTMYDTGSNSVGSITAYRAARADHLNPNGSNNLTAIVGCARSDASKPMATLGGIDKVVQSSYWSTSDGLEDTGVYPYFSRSIPADSAVAKAAAEFFSFHGYQHIGIAFVQDPYGEAYKDGFVKSCQELDINVITAGFIGGDIASINATVEVLEQSNIKVGLFVGFDGDYPGFVVKASEEDMKVAGVEGTLWVLADGVSDTVVNALGGKANGMGKLLAQGGVAGNAEYDKFLDEWSSMDTDTALKTYAESIWTQTTSWGGPYQGDTNHAMAGQDLTKIPATFFADNLPNDVATYAYDATVSLGLAACDYTKAGGSLDASSFNADSFITSLKRVNYTSVSGYLEFLQDSASRDPATGNYVLYNFQCETSATTCSIYTLGKWTKAGGWDYSTSNAPTTSASPNQPFRFSNNLITPVPDLITPPEKKNLLDSSLVSVGTLLVVINYCVAGVLLTLTFTNRRHKVIRASQPLFLCMVIFGCCISTTTIIFFGQSDEGDYDKAGDVDCMMQPFFYSFGFIFSFAALFAKVTRIVKIFGNKKLARVTITWFDMMKPIGLLLAIDLAILLAWFEDEDAKLKWVRVPKTTDSFGNVLESTGMCRSEDPWLYAGLILALHFAVLVYGNYMCYQGRHAGTAFSESKYVFMAMVSNLQIMALGLPMLIMVYDNPTSNYFMRTGIVFFNDVGVMLLIFVPKFALIYFGSEDDLNAATSTQTSSGATKTGGDSDIGGALAERVQELEAENDDLKKEIEKLKN
eukprot:CAMPEP_0118652406 /NCGR_PEP_ID=MMETSP0785-20121206/11299_1 /TAXON_ID=91992 /ORGANISM="Bolidomonas pacifica, Strain CCMP 1866" /LENGTH=812 /DNA_ID=CAMNT_0006544917 /DNA_START=83 /DNA_END=2521 /DNA_ORIENTATION=+